MDEIVYENRSYLGVHDKPGQRPFFDAGAVQDFYNKINRQPESLEISAAPYDEDEIVGLITMYALASGVQNKRLKRAGYLVDALRGATPGQIVAAALESGEILRMRIAQDLKSHAASATRKTYDEGDFAPPSNPNLAFNTRHIRRLSAERQPAWVGADQSETPADASTLPTPKQLVQEVDRKWLMSGRAAVALYKMIDIGSSPEGESPDMQEAIEKLSELRSQLYYEDFFTLTPGENDALRGLLNFESLFAQVRKSAGNGGPDARDIQTNLLSALHKLVSLAPDLSKPT